MAFGLAVPAAATPKLTRAIVVADMAAMLNLLNVACFASGIT